MRAQRRRANIRLLQPYVEHSQPTLLAEREPDHAAELDQFGLGDALLWHDASCGTPIGSYGTMAHEYLLAAQKGSLGDPLMSTHSGRGAAICSFEKRGGTLGISP